MKKIIISILFSILIFQPGVVTASVIHPVKNLTISGEPDLAMVDPDQSEPVFIMVGTDLDKNILRGSFDTDCKGGQWKNFEIRLNDFTLQPAPRYQFSNYPVESLYTGPIAKLDTNSHKMARIFPTRIRAQLAAGINFGGHYTITMAGCGTECQIFIITNTRTGRVIDSLTTRAGAAFKKNSRLLILNPEPHCIATDLCSQKYYEIEGDRLILLD